MLNRFVSVERNTLKEKIQFVRVLFITATVFLKASGIVWSDGFRIPGLSADAMGKSEAVVASGQDASAVWYNPAGLTSSGRLDLNFNLNNMFLPIKYTNLLNQEEKSKKTHFPLPSLYVGSNVGTENLAVGLGVNTPFGLETEYSKTSAFRYITTGGRITLINVNPSVAYQVHPTFSIGAGLDYYYSTVELRQQFPWAAVGLTLGIGSAFPDGSVTVQGKGDGFGFNTGILYRPVPEHSFGLTYRSQVVVKYSGKKAELTNIPAAVQAAGIFPAGTGDVFATGARSSIRFPDMVSLGYAYIREKWTFELGGLWTNWDDIRTIDVNLDQPNALFPNTSNKFDWKNSFAVRTGAEYRFSDQFTFSGGFFIDQTPTNEATYSPLVPDGDHYSFSTALKWTRGDFSIQVPLVGILQTGTGSIDSRVTDTTGTQNADGKYDVYIFQIGIGFQYKLGS